MGGGDDQPSNSKRFYNCKRVSLLLPFFNLNTTNKKFRDNKPQFLLRCVVSEMAKLGGILQEEGERLLKQSSKIVLRTLDATDILPPWVYRLFKA